MTILGSIMSSILGGRAAPPPPAPGPQPRADAPPAAAPVAATPPAAPAAGQVDIAAVLDRRAAQTNQKLDWRKSIVDLMKLLELDSTLGARKRLAQELKYSGDTGDSAAMNIWLHKQVMLELSEHGGKVPAELKR
jgi:hypothetical protein